MTGTGHHLQSKETRKMGTQEGWNLKGLFQVSMKVWLERTWKVEIRRAHSWCVCKGTE